MNKIYFGDNLDILKTLENESVDLIYIDPPFNTGKTQTRKTIRTVKDENGDRKGFQGNTYKTVELDSKSYKDSFNHDHNGLIREDLDKSYEIIAPNASIFFLEEFLRPRLEEANRILKSSGSLYFHIDYRESHYCKILLDKIFGRDNFINEIIWAYDFGGRAKSRWPAKHDNILLYVKNKKKYVFHTDELETEEYMAPGLVGPEKAENGKLPTDMWYWSYVGKKGMWNPDTWWMTIVGTNSKERIGYPTQKPLRLLNRIIQASSFPNDTVLDFFAGSGTVGESCILNNRKFILVDNNEQSLEVMAKRFNGIENIEWIDFDPTPYQDHDAKRLDLIEKKHAKKIIKFSNEFKELVVLSTKIQENEEELRNDLWKNSPFEWIRKLPARSKGKYAREILIRWLNENNLDVKRVSGRSDERITYKNRIFAIKFSSLWNDGETYQFQQIKSNGPEFVICFGISPFRVHCWILEKELAIKTGSIQHKGAQSAEFWLQIDPKRDEDWLKGKGGTLVDARNRLIEIGEKG